MIMENTLTQRYNSDAEEFTVAIEWCEISPGVHIEQVIEGVGDTLADALRDLADQIENLRDPASAMYAAA